MTANTWQQLRPMFKLFSKTIRPWKRSDSAPPAQGTYDDGWNDCLAAVKKAEATWFKNMDQKTKTKVIHIRSEKT
jgi:hypothetical protein